MKRILLPVGIISILIILSYADWGMESNGYTDWGVPIEIKSSNTSYRADSLWNKGGYRYGDLFLRRDIVDTLGLGVKIDSMLFPATVWPGQPNGYDELKGIFIPEQRQLNFFLNANSPMDFYSKVSFWGRSSDNQPKPNYTYYEVFNVSSGMAAGEGEAIFASGLDGTFAIYKDLVGTYLTIDGTRKFSFSGSDGNYIDKIGSSSDPVDTAWIHKLTVSGNAVLGSGGNDTVDMSGSSLVKFPPGDIVFNVVRPDANHAGSLGKSGYYYLDGYFDRISVDSSLKFTSNNDSALIYYDQNNKFHIALDSSSNASANPDTLLVHGVLKASKGIVGAGGVGGSGTANRIAMWTDASTLGNSNIYQNSSDNRIGIGPVNFSNNSEILVVGGKIGIQAGSIYIGSAGSNDGMSFNLFNIGIGYNALRSISTSNSNYNIGIGSNALYYCNNGGNNNVGIGVYALGNLTNGSYNVGIGQFAGYYKRTDNSTNPKKSIFIGRYTRSYDDTDSNEIVIGDSAIGKGSNTVVLGNDNIKETYLKGAIVGSSNLAGKIIFSNQSRVAYYLAGVDSSDVVTLTLENRNENDAGMAVINGYCKTDSIIVTAWTMNTLGTWSLKSITGAVQYVIIRR